ncbi:fibroblast growth factor 18-like isoform X2 [Ptychodera flava]|uniref:fibroblast growth factor 18-like isoform X2 n=1 Tax=Ptychodera flava TaxID=63121 RepID=UPI00396A142E
MQILDLLSLVFVHASSVHTNHRPSLVSHRIRKVEVWDWREVPVTDIVWLTPIPGLLLGTSVSIMLRHRCLSLLLHVLLWCWHLQESIQLSDSDGFTKYVKETMGRPDTLSRGVERTVQLYSKASQKHVRIYGKNVDADGENGDVYARIIIEGDNFESQVTIRGEKTGSYLCMNHKGKVISKRKRRDDSSYTCTFQEVYAETGFSHYRLARNPDWYLGFGKNGHSRRAQNMKRGQKWTEFLKREVPEEAEITQTERERKRLIFSELLRTTRRAARSKGRRKSRSKQDRASLSQQEPTSQPKERTPSQPTEKTPSQPKEKIPRRPKKERTSRQHRKGAKKSRKER